MNNFKKLSFKELILTNGGGDPNGCSGCSAGAGVREWFLDLIDPLLWHIDVLTHHW